MLAIVVGAARELMCSLLNRELGCRKLSPLICRHVCPAAFVASR